jgi:hypothetical protein
MGELKALLVVLVLASFVFAVGKSTCLRFMGESDFSHRRNTWFTLTICAFVISNFWLYSAIAFAVMYRAGKKDKNPVALYVLLLHVVPPLGMELPTVFVSNFFKLDNYRILAFAILIPTAWQIANGKSKNQFDTYKVYDRWLIAYLLLQLALFLPYEELTNTVRRGVLFAIDSMLLFYVVSRTCSDRHKLIETMAMCVLAGCILATVAVFESPKGWLLYGLAPHWGINLEITSYLLRGDILRSQASAGHALSLGYMLAIILGFWLFLSSELKPRKKVWAGVIIIWAGLIAAFSRAPWLAAVLVFLIYQFMCPNGLRQLSKTLLVATPIFGIVIATPFGDRIIDNLPFVGKVGAENVDYRQNLATASWERIQEYPFFGDPFFMSHLEHLRQGQGIIDLVNVYLTIAMQYGVVGLLLFLLPFLMALTKTWYRSRNLRIVNPQLSGLGAALAACFMGTLFFIATCSFVDGIAKFYYILMGLAVGYLHIVKSDIDGHRTAK